MYSATIVPPWISSRFSRLPLLVAPTFRMSSSV